MPNTELAETASPRRRQRPQAGRVFRDAQGLLQQERPDDPYVRWTEHPVGLAYAQDLAARLDPREYALLETVAARRYLTLAQLARRFYGSLRWAHARVAPLYRDRLLARLDPTPLWMARVVAATGRHPWVYHLDWNGRWALELLAAGGRRPVAFDPVTIAVPGPMTAPLLGVNEVWSFFLGLARQSVTAGWGPLAVGWRDAPAATVRYGRRKGAAVQPDAEIVLRLGVLAGHPAVLAQEAQRPTWQRAELPAAEWPTVTTLTAQVQAATPALPIYRTLLLEFELGAQHAMGVDAQIARYNDLVAARPTWEARFGPRFPRVLVVTRSDADLLPLATRWRRQFVIRPKPGSLAAPVLVTSLPRLQAAERQPAGLRGRCWLHAMDPDLPDDADPRLVLPRLLTLGEALAVPDLADDPAGLPGWSSEMEGSRRIRP